MAPKNWMVLEQVGIIRILVEKASHPQIYMTYRRNLGGRSRKMPLLRGQLQDRELKPQLKRGVGSQKWLPNLVTVMSNVKPEVQVHHEMLRRVDWVEFLDHIVILIFLFLHWVATRIFSWNQTKQSSFPFGLDRSTLVWSLWYINHLWELNFFP
jgi:hypothetical protein